LNTFAPTVASHAEPRPAPCGRAAARGLLALAALALALAAAGCASKPPRPSPPPPVVVVKPPPRPIQPPVRPPPTPTPEVVAPPPTRNFAQEKATRKLQLAAEERNAIEAADVGYYLDVLVGRLKQSLGTDTGIARRGNYIVVVLPADAAFPVGGAALTPPLRAKLAPLAKALLEYRRVLVSVYVRADASVIGASNPRLAEQRAQVLAAYFGGSGLDPRRILTAPAGPSRPSANRPGSAGRTRIEIELEPILRTSSRAGSRG
jgi:outer membrane protein OmpA-like peptidoglycan-associated protein